ncbi:MAG: acyltransferase [Verrucomicrobiaceae bacterium]
MNLILVRMSGVKLGENIILNGRPFVKIRKGGEMVFEDGVSINSSRWSNPLNTEKSVSLFAGPEGKLVLREGAGVSGCQIIAYSTVRVGKSSLVGAGSLICDSNMHEVPLGSPEGIRVEPIEIGDSVFVGARCIILKGVTIGDGAVVAAGSVVIGNVAPNTLVGGNPAKVIKTFES